MLTAGELVELTLDGESVRGGTASSEIGMHLRLYALRPDIRAVVHAHPPTATAFAVTGVALRADVLPELIVQVGPVALVPYARSGTSALGDALEPFATGHDAFLLANHGATTVGATLSDALIRMESLEHAARILVAASLLGEVRPLPPGEVEELGALRELRRRDPGDFDAGLPPLSAHDDLQK
jgi:L-fuculose-phosphate aldolase